MSPADMLNEFVLLWAVVDPIGTIPVFLAVAIGMSSAKRKQLAFKSVLIASLVLLFFGIAGEALLNSMALPIASFQIAGGIILFIFATSMIFGTSKPENEISQIDTHNDLAVFPLAMPSIASPGAILAVIMMTDSHRNSFSEQLITMLLLALVLLSVLVLLLFATKIDKLIGKAGASIASRVMGLLLASVAVDNVIQGIVSHINATGISS